MIGRTGIFAATLLALSGCGNMDQGGDTRSAVIKGLRGMIPWGREDGVAAAPDTGADIAAAPAGSIFFEIPAFSIASVGVPATVTDSKVTWLAAPVSVTTQFGFLIATRGLPEDVLAIEVTGFGDAMASGGTYTRQMEWLGPRDQVIRSTFTCRISVQPGKTLDLGDRHISATLYEDTCTGENLQFTNEYWVDSEKTLRKTRQWVSESVGYLQSRQL